MQGRAYSHTGHVICPPVGYTRIAEHCPRERTRGPIIPTRYHGPHGSEPVHGLHMSPVAERSVCLSKKTGSLEDPLTCCSNEKL